MSDATAVECYRRRLTLTERQCLGAQVREYDGVPGLCARCPIGRSVGERVGIRVPIVSLALALIAACGTPYTLHASKTSAELAAEAQSHCRSLSTRRTVWTVAGSVLGAASGGAGPIESAIPTTNAGAREGVVVGGVVAGVLGAVAATLATMDGVAFEQNCALSSSASGAP